MNVYHPVANISPVLCDRGVLAGTPMIEIVLRSEAEQRDVRSVVKDVRECAGAMRWVTISTHGMRVSIEGQSPIIRLDALTTALRAEGFITALDTHGFHPVTGKWSWVSVTANAPHPGHASPLPAVVASASELRWLVKRNQAEADLDSFLRIGMHQPTAAVVLVANGTDREASSIATRLAFARGWRRSIV